MLDNHESALVDDLHRAHHKQKDNKYENSPKNPNGEFNHYYKQRYEELKSAKPNLLEFPPTVLARAFFSSLFSSILVHSLPLPHPYDRKWLDSSSQRVARRKAGHVCLIPRFFQWEWIGDEQTDNKITSQTTSSLLQIGFPFHPLHFFHDIHSPFGHDPASSQSPHHTCRHPLSLDWMCL